MALQNTGKTPESVADWSEYLEEKLKVTKEVAEDYARSLVSNGYCWETVKLVVQNTTIAQPCQSLLDRGFKIGHCLKMAVILKCDRQSSERPSTSGPLLKIPRPVLSLDINQVDYDQFCFEWRTYRAHYQISHESIASHLFYCGNDDVRKRIRIECPLFTTCTQRSEGELLDILKSIVLSKMSKIVHVKQFCSIKQNRNESCSDYLARLQTKASCCGFACTSCGTANTNERVK